MPFTQGILKKVACIGDLFMYAYVALIDKTKTFI